MRAYRTAWEPLRRSRPGRGGGPPGRVSSSIGTIRGVTPYYDDGECVIYHGDCREVLPELSFDSMVTDPPYGTGNAAVANDDVYPFDVVAGSVPTVAFGSAKLLVSTLAGFVRPPDRVMVWAPAFALSKQSSGGVLFRWDPIFVWDQLNLGHGGLAGDVFKQFEPGATSINKPVSMMRQLVSLVPGTIVDPFMGRGSTLRAAKDERRPAIGIEVEERLCEHAALRLGQGVLDL